MRQRVLRHTNRQLSATFYTGSTPVDADGAVTVDVTRADGSAFLTDQATTLQGANSGTYAFTLDAQDDLELFTLLWEGTFGGEVQRVQTQAEIVGGFYVSLAELKAESGLSGKSDEELTKARQWFEDKAESWCGVAFVPRFARDVLDGPGRTAIKLDHPRPRRVLAASVGGVAQTGFGTWDLYDDGTVIRDSGSFPFGNLNVAISYEHGHDAPDGDLIEAALVACRARVLGDASGGGIPAGVTQLITDAGTYNFGRQTFPTGLPEVDAVLRERREVLVA